MSATTESKSDPAVSRRDFLKHSSSALIGATVLGGLSIERSAYAAGSSQLKICLVGCGGRGSGAAEQALSTEGDVKLVAMADVRPEQITKHLDEIKKKMPDRVDVPPEHQFTDFEGYKKAI